MDDFKNRFSLLWNQAEKSIDKTCTNTATTRDKTALLSFISTWILLRRASIERYAVHSMRPATHAVHAP